MPSKKSLLPKKDRVYRVHSMFHTLQGEGTHAGRAAVFVRMTGCDVWSGEEHTRKRDIAKGFCARVCDTHFVGQNLKMGGMVGTAKEVCDAIIGRLQGARLVVFTGGEPLLQVDDYLLDTLWDSLLPVTAFPMVAVETNGRNPMPQGSGITWVTLSPKPVAGADHAEVDASVLQRVSELKVLWPHPFDPNRYLDLLDRKQARDLVNEGRLWISPIDGELAGTDTHDHVKSAVEFVKANPAWRLNIQMHKVVRVP